jgi:thymidylate kinase
VLITFSGLDGAGKSTLIEFVSATFEHERRAVCVLHLNDEVGIYALIRSLRDRISGGKEVALAPGAPDPRSQKLQRPAPMGWRGVVSRWRTAIVWNKPTRRLLYLVDLAIFQCYRFWLEAIRGRVLIMDRYFYDTLVDVTNGRRRLWTRVLEHLTPEPTVPVFLDISPEESFRRKREFSIDYLRHRAAVYHSVFARVPGAVRLVNTDLDRTKAALLEVLHARSGV